jgi:hypothetical protein
VLVGEVHAGGRLVEEEQLGLTRERPGDQHALLLAARQGRDAVAGTIAQADDLERVLDRGPVSATCGTQQPTAGQTTRGDDLADARGHTARGGGALRDEADAVVVAELLQRGAEDAHGAPGQWS